MHTHFPKECVTLKPKEQKLIKVKALSIDDISGLAINKVLDGSTYSTIMLWNIKLIGKRNGRMIR